MTDEEKGSLNAKIMGGLVAAGLIVAVVFFVKSNRKKAVDGLGDLDTAKTKAGRVKHEIARDGIAHAKGQIKKLESEIENMLLLKKNTSGAFAKAKIDDIIKWDRKLISDFRDEIATLKRRL